MKTYIGVAVALLGILLGAWVGIWVMATGGIVQVVEACKAEPVSSIGVAVGVVRFLSSAFVGWLCVGIGFGVGKAIVD